MADRSTSGDDAARFLRELRQLRDGAGLGQAELAARAHYPYDSIRAAEVGPALPELPVLAAYVKGCGGTTEEWEERWRSLTRSPSLPLQATRDAGNSAAATAGARIGSATQDAETPDPAVIIAALNRVADDMASTSDSLPEPAGVRSWTDLPAEASAPAPLPATPLPAAPLPAAEAEPWTVERPAGWDPIRVSTAWPALPPSALTPSASRQEPGGDAGQVTAAPWEAAPWEAAPWAEDPAGTEAAATAEHAGAGTTEASTIGTGTTGTGIPRAAGLAAAQSGAMPAPASRAPRGASADGTASQSGGSSRTRVLVVSAVLLCVIAVLLAVFV